MCLFQSNLYPKRELLLNFNERKLPMSVVAISITAVLAAWAIGIARYLTMDVPLTP